MNKKGWIITLVVIAVLVVLVVVVSNQDKGAVNDSPIKIGLIGAFTGEAAFYGVEDGDATKLAVDEINKAGGIDGRQIELIEEDGKCSGPDALSAAQKLINVDKVKIILGSTCSGETLAFAGLSETNKVLVVSGYSSSPDLTSAGDYIFRTSFSDVDVGVATAELAAKNGVKKIAVLSENTDFAVAFTKVFVSRFEELGGSIVYEEKYAPGTNDFRTQLSKVVTTKPDAILFSPQGEGVVFAFKQLAEFGYKGGLYANTSAGQTNVIDKAGASIDGMYFVNNADLDITRKESSEFLRAFKSKYGRDPEAFAVLSAGKYDSVYILKNAIEEVGSDTEKIKDYLYSMPAYKGAMGDIRFDANGDIIGLTFENFQVQEGEIVGVE